MSDGILATMRHECSGEKDGFHLKGDGACPEGSPPELQCYHIDMDNPELDPIEWAIRKVVPIPKVYYWETSNYDLPLKAKAWHRTISILGKLATLAECTGNLVARIAGLNSSRYDYVTSTMNEEQWKRSERNAEVARQRHLSAEGHWDNVGGLHQDV